MSIEAGPAAQSQTSSKPHIVRRTADFHPSIWGDQFLNHTSQDIKTQARMQQEVEELKVVVRKELFIGACDFSHQLKSIDAIQCLGVAYHFEKEIEQTLEHMHATYHDHYDDDLYKVALGFRLLRQHGYNVSCDVFNKFKGTIGSFKESLIANVPSMLSFYEATHLRMWGEDILEEALVFITTHLESVATHVSYQLTEQISEALERPLRKSLERICTRRYIPIYQDDASHNEALLKLAKLDFNLVQSLHKRELSEFSRWWKEVDFERKLPFARDRIVELYFWIVGVYFEPHYSAARKILSKIITLGLVLDDIYDAFGTFKELEVFTAAIQRWDVNCIDELPDYMQIFYHTLLNAYNEIEEEVAVKEGRSYPVYYAKEAMKAQARFYFAEAKWLHEEYIPSVEEYMHVAASSVGNSLLSVSSLVGMGDIVTEEAFKWLSNGPKILRASNTIFRLMDDIAGSKFEKKRGHVSSSIDCYMKQYGVTELEAIDVLNKKVVDSWKDINEEFLRPTAVPMPILMRLLNLTRIDDLLYKRGDGFTHVGKLMKDIVASLFIDPVPL